MVILLVDDDLGVQFYAWTYFQEAGFVVLTADDGRAALDLSRNYPGVIDLLLSDVDMPRMDGLELYRHIAAQRPEIKVLMMSGDLLAMERVAMKGLSVLKKPFTLTALWRSVEELLGPIPHCSDGD
jgi:DNA-binding response OmpR family regulator